MYKPVFQLPQDVQDIAEMTVESIGFQDSVIPTGSETVDIVDPVIDELKILDAQFAYWGIGIDFHVIHYKYSLPQLQQDLELLQSIEENDPQEAKAIALAMTECSLSQSEIEHLRWYNQRLCKMSPDTSEVILEQKKYDLRYQQKLVECTYENLENIRQKAASAAEEVNELRSDREEWRTLSLSIRNSTRKALTTLKKEKGNSYVNSILKKFFTDYLPSQSVNILPSQKLLSYLLLDIVNQKVKDELYSSIVKSIEKASPKKDTPEDDNPRCVWENYARKKDSGKFVSKGYTLMLFVEYLVATLDKLC